MSVDTNFTRNPLSIIPTLKISITPDFEHAIGWPVCCMNELSATFGLVALGSRVAAIVGIFRGFERQIHPSTGEFESLADAAREIAFIRIRHLV